MASSGLGPKFSWYSRAASALSPLRAARAIARSLLTSIFMNMPGKPAMPGRLPAPPIEKVLGPGILEKSAGAGGGAFGLKFSGTAMVLPQNWHVVDTSSSLTLWFAPQLGHAKTMDMGYLLLCAGRP